MSGDPISEELVTLLHAVAEDEALRAVVLRLEALPLALRQAALWRMADQMRADGQDDGVIKALCALAHPGRYAAACRVLREWDS